MIAPALDHLWKSVLLTGSFLALAVGAAQAQPAPSQPKKPAASTAVSPVTVKGPAPPKEIKKQTWSFVEAYAAATPKLDLIGRWHEEICVQVVNLTPEQAAVLKARIEQVAKGVGLKVMKPGCASNIQIVLTSQPQAFIDIVAKSNEHTLGFHYPSDLKKVKTVTHPIQAWYKTATESSKIGDDGLSFANLTNAAGEPINNTGNMFARARAGESVDIPENPTPKGCAGSLITHCLRSTFRNVLVVLDSHAVEGKDLGAVADYAAMLALAQPRSLDGCSALSSILDLMAKSPCAGRDAPDQLTAADASYLTALYASNPESSAITERGDIAGRMSEMLIKANRVAPSARTGAGEEGKR